jgi:hypothetical protein
MEFDKEELVLLHFAVLMQSLAEETSPKDMLSYGLLAEKLRNGITMPPEMIEFLKELEDEHYVPPEAPSSSFTPTSVPYLQVVK